MNSDDSLPKAFLDRLSLIIDARYLAQVIESFVQPKHAGFRWNSLLGVDKSQMLHELEPIANEVLSIGWYNDAFYVTNNYRDLLVASSAAEKSLIYIQNPSSLLPCLVLDPQPGESVLDLCAAPGGKTLMLASLMNNQGLLSAVEAIRPRFFKLQNNLKRYGCEIARTYLSDGRSVGRKVAGRFDRVLIDVPCSGESRIHQSEPESFEFWSERKVKEQSRKQYGLIRSGFEALRPGGRLVYCTCSFAPEENEKIVSDFLQDQRDAKLLPIEIPQGVEWTEGMVEWKGKQMHSEVNKTIRIIPNQLMNGFFLACIEKKV